MSTRAARRRAGWLLVAVLPVGLGMSCVAALGGTSAAAAAGRGSEVTAPSWLDLASEIGQIAHSQSGTEAALLSVDAAIRNGLNGTTAGYVYAIVSDSAQLALTLHELGEDASQLVTQWTAAHARGRAAERSWAQERHYYEQFQPIVNAGGCVSGAPQYQQCVHDEQEIAAWFDDQGGSKVAGPPSPTNDDVYAATTTGSYLYGETESTLSEVLSTASEALFEARAITGDAKDYPGNKEIEAVVQVIGERDVAKALGTLIADGTGLRSHLQDQVTEMTNCYNSGAQMDDAIQVPSGAYPLPAPSYCAPA